MLAEARSTPFSSTTTFVPSTVCESDAGSLARSCDLAPDDQNVVDHVTGLLNLRESQSFSLYGHRRVLDVLAANSIFNVLNPAFVARRALPMGEPTILEDGAGTSLGFSVRAFPVPGKVALWLEDSKAKDFGTAERLAHRSWSLGPKLGPLCARNWQTVVEMRLQFRDQAGAASARKWVAQCHKAGVPRY